MRTMPAEADEEDQPRLLKSSVKLFPHQRQALAWLLWRETQVSSIVAGPSPQNNEVTKLIDL